MSLTASEARRKLVHMGVGGLAFLFRFQTWPEAALMAVAAFLFNWRVLPRIGGRGLWRSAEHEQGHARGILIYPLAVLGLVLVFHDELWKAAALWGILALGDGMAAFVGLGGGGPRLPWNPAKSWAGTAAFVLFGSVAASVLAVWTLRLPLAAWISPRILAVTVPVALFCALVESLPTTLDDNLTVPIAGAVALAVVSDAVPARLLEDPGLAPRLAVGAAVNAAIALAARAVSSLDTAGALSAVAIGTAITAGLGGAGLLLMIVFFVIGTAATRFGYARKAARGIAQEKGGARGWRNAWANGGVPAAVALLAGMAPAELRPVWALAYAGAVATAAADTCSSEVGKAVGGSTFLITGRRVPPGTEGGVSLAGTLAGAVAGTLVAAVGAGGRLYPWSLVPLVVVAGLAGSLAESALGTVAERRGWMGNDALNALNTAFGAAAAAALRQAFSDPSPALVSGSEFLEHRQLFERRIVEEAVEQRLRHGRRLGGAALLGFGLGDDVFQARLGGEGRRRLGRGRGRRLGHGRGRGPGGHALGGGGPRVLPQHDARRPRDATLQAPAALELLDHHVVVLRLLHGLHLDRLADVGIEGKAQHRDALQAFILQHLQQLVAHEDQPFHQGRAREVRLGRLEGAVQVVHDVDELQQQPLVPAVEAALDVARGALAERLVLRLELAVGGEDLGQPVLGEAGAALLGLAGRSLCGLQQIGQAAGRLFGERLFLGFFGGPLVDHSPPGPERQNPRLRRL